jgi:hypothetical protein
VKYLQLYKYCPWNSNKHIKNNLKNSILYFQKPDLLNDPFDVFPAAEITKSNNTLAAEDLSAALIHKIRNSIGVCCFTTDPKSLVMWAHYADKHSGICLCFDFPDDKSIISPSPNWTDLQSKANISITPQSVTYARARPKMNLFSGSNLTSFFLTKYEAWDYEKEYRAFTLEDYGEFNYNPEYLTGIIAGCKMPDKNLTELRELIKVLPSPVQLFITVPEHNAFRLDIKNLDF